MKLLDLFVYRRECLKTTWQFRLTLLGAVVAVPWLSSGWWLPTIAQTLVCNQQTRPAEAIIVDNFDSDYLLFERAEVLYRAGLARRILIPTEASAEGEESVISRGFVEVMAHVARLEHSETIPVRQLEPISLNVTTEIRDYLIGQKIRSLLLVTPGFRSERSFLVYREVMGRANISFSCVPVFGQRTPETWANTWHGIQEVIEQFLKLQYYRFYVLPVYSWRQAYRRQG